MKDKIFVDSNIWIYLFTSDDVSKNESARSFITDNTIKGNFSQAINGLQKQRNQKRTAI